jgi:hypothetical protein
VSADQCRAAAEVIEHLLSALHGSPPPDLGALLSVLSDCLAQLEHGLQVAGARTYLAGIDGSGKAAQLATALSRTP